MRTELAHFVGKRITVSAIFSQYGSRRTNKTAYLLLTNVLLHDSGELLTDHVWVRNSIKLSKLGRFDLGEKVIFTATVYQYTRKRNSSKDYSFSKPKNVCNLQENVKYFGYDNETITGNVVPFVEFQSFRNIKKFGAHRLFALSCLRQF